MILLGSLFIACAPKQRIIPLYNPEKISNNNGNSSAYSGDRDSSDIITPVSSSEPSDTDHSNRAPSNRKKDLLNFEGAYYFEDVSVDKPVGTELRLVDGILNNILNIIVKIGGNFEVASDPIPVDLSELDREVVKELFIFNIDLQISDPEKTKANLKFMKEVTIKLVKTDEENPDNDQLEELVAINFKLKDEENKAWAEKCDYKCLRIPVSNKNLLNFLADSKKIMVVPVIKLGAAPKENFSINGSMKFKVGLNVDL